MTTFTPVLPIETEVRLTDKKVIHTVASADQFLQGKVYQPEEVPRICGSLRAVEGMIRRQQWDPKFVDVRREVPEQYQTIIGILAIVYSIAKANPPQIINPAKPKLSFEGALENKRVDSVVGSVIGQLATRRAIRFRPFKERLEIASNALDFYQGVDFIKLKRIAPPLHRWLVAELKTLKKLGITV